MIKYLFQMNYACVLICVFLLIFLIVDRSYEKKIRLLFIIAIAATLILTAADSVDYYIAQGTTPFFIRRVTSALGYALRPLTIFAIALVVRRWEKRTYLLSLPFLFNAAVSFASIWTGWMFYFDSDNQFHRGMLWVLPFVISGFYLIAMLFWNVKEFRRNGVGELLVIIAVVVLTTFAVTLEILKVKFLLNPTIAAGLSAYYLFLHVQIYKRDPLTNLLNRRNFYLDAKEYSNVFMTVVSVDINNLKKINDSEGHDAGDQAIMSVAQAFYTAQSAGFYAYRTGGDEFMILAKKKTEEETGVMLQKMNRYLERTPYSISIGMAVFEPGMDFSQVCKRADDQMYENKRQSRLGRE